MANTKLTGLTAITSITDDAIFYVVSNPGGTPVSRKITKGNLLKAITDVLGTNPQSIDDTVTPTSNPATQAVFNDMVGNILKTMSGAANWYGANVSLVASGGMTFQARLTLTSGTPLTTANVTAATVLYLTPYYGKVITIYSGSAWERFDLAEVSIKVTDTQNGTLTTGNPTVTGLTSTSQFVVGMKISGTGIAASSVINSIDSATQITMNNNATATGAQSLTFKIPTYTPLDVFVYSSSGTPKLEFAKWTNATTRATALTTQDGVYVKTGATSRLYVGTVCISGTDGELEDSLTWRGVWNAYNQETRKLYLGDSTNHTYATATNRYWNNDGTQNVKAVIGLNVPVYIIARVRLKASTGGNVGTAGIYRDGTTGTNTGCEVSNYNTQYVYTGNMVLDVPDIGYHYYLMAESAPASTVYDTYAMTLWVMG